MSDRGDRNIWDGTTNALYSGHKLAGFILLILMVARLAWRLVKGAPPPDASIEPWQRTVSALNHWGLYILLFAMALTGWLGVSLFPALDIFGLFSLPALTSPDQAAAGARYSLTSSSALRWWPSSSCMSARRSITTSSARMACCAGCFRSAAEHRLPPALQAGQARRSR